MVTLPTGCLVRTMLLAEVPSRTTATDPVQSGNKGTAALQTSPFCARLARFRWSKPSIQRSASRPVFKVLARSSSKNESTARQDESDISYILERQKQKRLRLSNPVHLTTSCSAKANVQDVEGAGSIYNYIRLPAEEYTSDVLAGGQIVQLKGNLFRLSVPKITFFDVWLEPVIDVIVKTPSANAPSRVQLTAVACTITGSDLIERMNLNRRFVMSMETQLTLKEGLTGTSADLKAGGQLDVWCEVIPPFNLLPRSLLASTCNAVMRTVMKTMLSMFITRLAADYQRWATDEGYREERRNN